MHGATVNSVFPAYAGMSRRPTVAYATVIGFPRLRGDEPRQRKEGQEAPTFSPPTRG